jgi:very-short-patch-repair endonuclease
VSKSKDFEPQTIANLMWAFATAGVSPDAALVQAMSSAAVSKSKDFKPQEIANLMWASATSGVSPDAALIQAMSSAAVSKSKDFNPQNIANLMWAFATSGVSPDAALIQAMSSAAVSKSKDFNPQNIANLVWAFATSGVSPDVAVVQAMSSAAVSKSKDFDAQAIANLMWAFATAGVSPDVAVVQAMSSAAVSKSKDFKPQAIANLMWAFATAGVSPDAALVRAMLEKLSADALDPEGRMQLHQYFLFNSLSAQPSDVSSLSIFAAECKEVFVAYSSSSTHTSKLQKDVARALRRLVSEEVLEEQVLEDSGFSVDARLAGTRVVVEVDGPHHYLRGATAEARQGRVLDGSTRFKHRTLTQLGWTVVQVPHFEWDALKAPGAQDQARYLGTLLASAGVPASGKE